MAARPTTRNRSASHAVQENDQPEHEPSPDAGDRVDGGDAQTELAARAAALPADKIAFLNRLVDRLSSCPAFTATEYELLRLELHDVSSGRGFSFHDGEEDWPDRLCRLVTLARAADDLCDDEGNLPDGAGADVRRLLRAMTGEIFGLRGQWESHLRDASEHDLWNDTAFDITLGVARACVWR